MDTSIIINSMSLLKTEFIAAELDKVYSDIFCQVSKASSATFANLFTSLEAKAISSFCVKLEKQMRLSAYEAMQKAGVPESEIPLLWIRVRNAVPAPKAQLCSEGNYTPPGTNNQQASVKDEINEEKSQLPKVGQWILISGVAVEILSWIFIPSYMVWAPVVRGIGLVIIGAGAHKIYQENKRPAQIPLTESAKKMLQKQAIEDVQKICDKQYELNSHIYCNWVDEITSAIAKECAEY